MCFERVVLKMHFILQLHFTEQTFSCVVGAWDHGLVRFHWGCLQVQSTELNNGSVTYVGAPLVRRR